jgi:PAS domain S-box-containing protein
MSIAAEVRRENDAYKNWVVKAYHTLATAAILPRLLGLMGKRKESRIAWPSVTKPVLFALALLFAGTLDALLTPNLAAPIGVTNALLLCALLVRDPKEWWFYLLLSFPFPLLVSGTTPWSLLVWLFVPNCARNVLCAWLLRRLSPHRLWFDSFRAFGKYFLIAVVLAPACTAFAGAASPLISPPDFWTKWQIWFLADALASLILTPFILLAAGYRGFSIQKGRGLEASLIAAGLAVATFFGFSGRLTGSRTLPSELYLPFPFLLWAAMEFGPLGAASSLLLTSVLMILQMRMGQSLLILQSDDTTLLSMQLLLFVGSASLIFMSVITNQRRKLETRLKQSVKRFRFIAHDVPAMVWMSGPDARCMFFSKPWLDFTGLSLEEQIKQDWVARIHPEDRERCVTEYLAAFRQRQNFTAEYRVLDKEGTYRWVFHTGAPRYATDGSFLGYTGSRIDFTDRRQAEEQLRKMSTQRINACETESYLAGQELHEDLAQKVFALSAGLSRSSTDEKRSPTGDFEQLQEQVNDICKDIVRLSHRLSPVTARGLGLSAALGRLCHEASAGERVVFFMQDGQPNEVPEDVSSTLYSIAQESLHNALTHSGATHIRVELSTSHTTVRLSVRDNGCGFVVGSMTQPGLGLFKMFERMRSAGGTFSINSNPGEGTSVTATMHSAHSMTVKHPAL